MANVRVLDLTHYVAGPNCTRMLAAFGAQVIKVERPDGGDPARRLGPFYRDHPHQEKSSLFLHLNSNKLGVTLNLKSALGTRILKSLAKEADILVESFRPGVMDNLGLSPQSLWDINPRLIVTSISNFGQWGPYRDYKASELVIFGLSGPLQVTGMPEREPVKMGGRIIQYQAGAVAALLTMVALWARDETGRGQHIDLPIMETQAGTMDRWVAMLVHFAYTGQITRRLPPAAASGAGVFPSKNGYVNILNPSNRGRLNRILEMIGRPDLIGDPRFATLEERYKLENIGILDSAFMEWMLQHTTQEILTESQTRKIMSGPVYTYGDLMTDPHLQARGPWLFVERPHTDGVIFPGRPMLMSRTPWQLKRPAPLLGEHNQEIYCGCLGYSSKDLEHLGQLEVI